MVGQERQDVGRGPEGDLLQWPRSVQADLHRQLSDVEGAPTALCTCGDETLQTKYPWSIVEG